LTRQALQADCGKGVTLAGRIAEKEVPLMHLKFFGLILLVLLAALPLWAEEVEAPPEPFMARSGSIGLGYGIPYGGKLGVNADVYFFDAAALTVGFGSYGHTAGYALGLKYLHGSSRDLWRPQALLLYGVNKALTIRRVPEGDLFESHSGFTLGLGSQFMFGKARRHGFDADLLVVVTSTAFKRLDELEEQGYNISGVSRFSFSLGYRYAFDVKF